MARHHLMAFAAVTSIATMAATTLLAAAQTPATTPAPDTASSEATATPVDNAAATAVPPTQAPVADDEPPPRPAVAKVPVLDFIGPSTDIGMIGAELTPRKYASPREESVFEIHGAFRSGFLFSGHWWSKS